MIKHFHQLSESIRMVIVLAVQFGATSNGCYNISEWRAQSRCLHEGYAENGKEHLDDL